MRMGWVPLLVLVAVGGCSRPVERPGPQEPTFNADRKGATTKVENGFRVIITAEEVACEHPKRKRESVRWEEVVRIWYGTTSEGPWLPDEWLLFEGEAGRCPVPTEAQGFDSIWDELKARLP